MAHLEVRRITPADVADAFDVVARTYHSGAPIENPDEWMDGRETFVGLADGRVEGLYQVHDFTASRGRAVIPCGGVALVCVAPEARRTGLGLEMMKSCVRERAASGYPMTSLYAFRETFYRKAGYEVAGIRLKITVPMSRLPKITDPLPVRCLSPEQRAEVEPVYRAFAERVSGMVVRSDAAWKRRMAENKAMTIYAAGNPAEAYIAVNHDTSFWVDQFVSEFVWSTPRGYDTMLGFIAGLGINKTAVAWHEPSASPFLARYMDQGISTVNERPIMFRVTDVPAALRLLQPDESGAFTLRVLDDVVSTNEGPWEVRFSPLGVQVSPAESATITLDVRQFAQAFLGEPSLAALVAMGLAQATDPGELAAANRLLPAAPVMCNDFF